ncbi:aquaporin-like protein [Fomitiporia mediterranea MF3/22]|uniref:aquaporin-like protein n=1 Tax=Fomitiporia mediterranea (strain MF3/22) TaxID=694068 RepID=UPI0004408D01|nr:aquaporin-like protein [Fomitiporia mediterranea MF3/22]EJD06583.1 aquaporin-like protein [Fomitiporia mediterranea MF3/22]
MHAEPPKFIHIADVVPRPAALKAWERQRHRRAHWLVECMAEFMGVFIYCYAGVGSTASMVVGTLAEQPFLGSLLQVGIAYAVGIVLALTICASTSGGHLNPCVTIAFCVFKRFPWKKAPQYIISQILGAYVACLIVYLQWRTNILQVEELLAAAGKLDAIQFTPNGPAGIIGLYTLPNANLGVVWANEFFADFFLGLAIWGCIDPSNFFCPPHLVPYTVGLAYAVVIWGFAPNALAANSARDVGGRLAALTLWGKDASGGNYAAIAALTNIPAMLLAALFYEIFFHDSSRVLPPAQRDFLFGHKAHEEHRDNAHGVRAGANQALSDSGSSHEADKGYAVHNA